MKISELRETVGSVERTGEDFVRGLGGREGDVRVFREIMKHYARRNVELYIETGRIPKTERDSLAGEPDRNPRIGEAVPGLTV